MWCAYVTVSILTHGIAEEKSQYTIGQSEEYVQMTLNDIALLFQNNCGIIAVCTVVLMSLVEISPIKINPWSWLGNTLNKGIISKLEKVEKDVAEVKKEVGESSAVTSRYRILRFDDEILHDVKHTKEHFDQILLDIDVYEKFCEENQDFKNNLAVMAINHIKEIYSKCSRENSFL